MQVIIPDNLKEKMDRVAPYLIKRKGKTGYDYAEETPEYIKDMYEECRQEFNKLLEDF